MLFSSYLRGVYDAFVLGSRSPHFWDEPVTVSHIEKSNLRFMLANISKGHAHHRIFANSKTLAIQWTDGSGIGTGGCSHLVDTSQFLETWSGDWPAHSKPFSSNFKELRSIKIAILRQLRVFRRYGTCLCHGRTLLHITDNSVSANILRHGTSSNDLLAREARTIPEATTEMCTNLITVHVSDKRMIAQGTDGLSRDTKLLSP